MAEQVPRQYTNMSHYQSLQTKNPRLRFMNVSHGVVMCVAVPHVEKKARVGEAGEAPAP